MKEMIKVLNETRKTNAKEFYGSIVVIIASFAMFYVANAIFHN